MITNDSFKFRLEVAIQPPQKSFKNLNRFTIWYNRRNSVDDPEYFDDVCEWGGAAFHEIAGWIANEYLCCKASTTKDFVFGAYGYETDSIFDHEAIYYAIKNMIEGIFGETFDYEFFENNKDNLKEGKIYEYLFEVSFEANKNSVHRTDLKVTKKKIKNI